MEEMKDKWARRSNFNSNITSFFYFVNKRASYPFDIISLVHASVNVRDIFRKRKYKLPSSNQSILYVIQLSDRVYNVTFPA